MMERCIEWRFQNMNESLHQRVYNIVRKIYFYNENRVLFAGQFVCVLTAFGYEHSIYKKLGFTEKQLELYRKTDEKTKTRSCNPYPKHRDKCVYDPKMPNNYSFGPGYAKLDDGYAPMTEGSEPNIEDIDDSVLAESVMKYPLPKKPPPWREPDRGDDFDDPDEIGEDVDDPGAIGEDIDDPGAMSEEESDDSPAYTSGDDLKDLSIDYGFVTDPVLLREIQIAKDDRDRYNRDKRRNIEFTHKMTKKNMLDQNIYDNYRRNDKLLTALKAKIIESDKRLKQKIIQAYNDQFSEEEEEAYLTSEGTEEEEQEEYLEDVIFSIRAAEQPSLNLHMEEHRKEQEEAQAKIADEDVALAVMASLQSESEHQQSKITHKGDASKIKGKSKVKQPVEEQCLPESPIGNQTTATMSIQNKKSKNEQQEQQSKSKKRKLEEQPGTSKKINVQQGQNNDAEQQGQNNDTEQQGQNNDAEQQKQQGQNSEAEQQDEITYQAMDKFTETFIFSTVSQLNNNDIHLDEQQGRRTRINIKQQVQSNKGKHEQKSLHESSIDNHTIETKSTQKKKIKNEQQGNSKKRKHEEQPGTSKKINIEQGQNNEKPIDDNEDGELPMELIPVWKIKKEGKKRR